MPPSLFCGFSVLSFFIYPWAKADSLNIMVSSIICVNSNKDWVLFFEGFSVILIYFIWVYFCTKVYSMISYLIRV